MNPEAHARKHLFGRTWILVQQRSARQLRAMYLGGHGNAAARRMARLWTKAIGLRILPGRWVTLEVPGRRTGATTRFPLGMADFEGEWYLVSMLGNDSNWVRNVRAAEGHATLRRRSRQEVLLQEVPPSERSPILKRYLQKVPGARPHIPVDRQAPVAAFDPIAGDYPVFRVRPS